VGRHLSALQARPTRIQLQLQDAPVSCHSNASCLSITLFQHGMRKNRRRHRMMMMMMMIIIIMVHKAAGVNNEK